MVQITRPNEYRLNALMVLGSKRELEYTRVVSTMIGHTKPYPYDDPGHRRPIEYVAHRHIGKADIVFVSNLLQYLEQFPATPGINHLLILPQAGRIQDSAPWLRLPEVGIGQQPTAERSIGEQRNMLLLAEGDHAHLRPQVDERILHLIRHNPDAVFRDGLQVGRVKVGQRQMS